MDYPITPASLVVSGSPPPTITKESPVNGTLSISGTSYSCTIKGHGNWTWGQPKKPYNIKLNVKAELLGMAPEKNWVLLANFSDRSFVNTALAMTLGNNLFEWTPHWRFIDLTLNGTYVGIYQLSEKVEIAGGRLDEPEVGTATTGVGLTGTYLMEINNQANGKAKFVTKRNVSIEWNDPDMLNPNNTKPFIAVQKAYIQDWIQNFEDALFAPDAFTRETNNYWNMIDGNSFATWYLIEELGSNQDSNFSGSCKLYKTQDGENPGVLCMGPLWDFDISFGNRVNVDHKADQFFTRSSNAVWLLRMFEDPTFLSKVQEVWKSMKETIGADGSGLGSMIDAITGLLGNSMSLDKDRWGYIYFPLAYWSYAPVNYLLYPTKKAWIKARVQFLDQHYGGT